LVVATPEVGVNAMFIAIGSECFLVRIRWAALLSRSFNQTLPAWATGIVTGAIAGRWRFAATAANPGIGEEWTVRLPLVGM
jgi:hypothetical protein